MAVILIPARYGSTRLAGKLVADLCGKPVIARVIDNCLKSSANRVIVVTDNDQIAKISSDLGAEYIMSSPDIATGTDRIAFAAKNIEDDIVINVQGDEPFIPYKVIDDLIDNLENNSSILMNTAATTFKDISLAHSPNHVKVIFDKDNFAIYFSRSIIPYDRDNVGITIYRHIGIYGFRRSFLLKYAAMSKGKFEGIEMLEQLRALENGVKIKVIETNYNPISIDTAEDLECARGYFINNSGDYLNG